MVDEGLKALCAGIVEGRALGSGETDTARVLDMFVTGTDNRAFDGQCFTGDCQLAATNQNGDEMELFHIFCISNLLFRTCQIHISRGFS